jgi:hypothetical protein
MRMTGLQNILRVPLPNWFLGLITYRIFIHVVNVQNIFTVFIYKSVYYLLFFLSTYSTAEYTHKKQEKLNQSYCSFSKVLHY